MGWSCCAAREESPVTRSDARVVASRSEIRDFLGGRGGVLAFLDGRWKGGIRWIDLDDPDLAVRALGDHDDCDNPILSPDGTCIVYGRESDGTVYARRLPGGTPVAIGPGALGYWHRQDEADHIVYCDVTSKTGYSEGGTYRQRLKNGIEPDGPRTVLCATGAFDGGVNGGGRWLGEAYGGIHARDLAGGRTYGGSWDGGHDFWKLDGTEEGQCCNASMVPDDSARLLVLVLPHDYIRLYEYQSSADNWQEIRTFVKPSHEDEWQAPDYSTDPDYFTAVGVSTAGPDGYACSLYVVRISDDARLRVIEHSSAQSHLAVRSSRA